MTIEIVSYNGHALNDDTNYNAVFVGQILNLPTTAARRVQRVNAHPLVSGIERGGRVLYVEILVRDGGSAGELLKWFDPEDEQAKQLLVTDEDGSNGRYMMAVCEDLHEAEERSGKVMVATLVVHGDPLWRATSADTDSWSVTASGQTNVVTNGGDTLAYPKFTITPTGAKSSGNGNTYRRFLTVLWAESVGASNHPVDITNNGLDTQIATTNFASATGDDMRVYVDGKAADFWIQDPDTATTQIWCNLDWQAQQQFTLNGGIDASQTTLVVSEDIIDMPEAGTLKIDNELMTYTARTVASKTFSGLTRGAKSTTAATHSDAATVDWVQHDIEITYGDSGLAAYSSDDTRKPIFDLSSTNAAWTFSDFGDNARLRAAIWQAGAGLGGNSADVAYAYTRDHSAGGSETTTPWAVIGLHQQKKGVTRWTFYSPRGISAANFTGGQKKTASAASSASFARVESSVDGNNWTSEYAIPATSGTTWESWSQNVTGLYTATTKETKHVALTIEEATESAETYKVEAGACVITHQASPTITIGVEISTSYSLGATITNNTTGDALSIAIPGTVNGAIEIDTSARTVTNLADNSSILSALTLVGGVRLDWLPLAVGSNTLQYDDTGTQAVTVDIEWTERYYD